jgi:hypothetical protein
MDFCIWGWVKDLVYRTPVETVNDLRERIETSFEQIRNKPGIFQSIRGSMMRRL